LLHQVGGGWEMQEFTHEYAYHWFHTPTPIEKAGGLWPIRAGRNLAKAHYKIGPRMIPYFSIHFVLEGEGIFTFEQNNLPITPGDFFCIFPNQTHTYKTLVDNPLQMVWIAFDGKQSKSLLQNMGVTPFSPVASKVIDEEVKKLLVEFISITSEVTVLTRLSKIYELFSKLIETSKVCNQPDPNDGSWLRKTIEFIETHYGEGITVEDVANYVGLHRSYLTSRFSKHLGYSPKKFIIACKMKQATKMMEEQRFNITEIAFSLGYSDLYSFSKAFKNYFGVSPKHYIFSFE
jgi:AraC-like DNA-binding protein